MQDAENKKRTAFTALYCLICAAVLLTVCSRSSFLYVFNNWDDANSYMTVGKSIFRGLVPYRDLFDQKGIMLYMLYGLASLISATTFHAVFVLEVLAAWASLYGAVKIFRLYVESEPLIFFLLPISGAVIYGTRAMWWGGSAEELLFPFLVWGLYLSLHYFREIYPAPMPRRTLLAAGVMAGCVLHIKFSSLGLYFAFMLTVFLAEVFAAKKPGRAFADCFVFLGGMALASVPWVIYFGANGAIGDWFHVYIIRNVFDYSEKLPMADRLYRVLRILIEHAIDNTAVFSAIGVGLLWFFVCALVPQQKMLKVSVPEMLNLFAHCFFLTIVIFIGGVRLTYYSFPMTVFVFTGMAAVGSILSYFLSMIKKKKAVRSWMTGAAALFLAFLYVWNVSINPPFRQVKAEDFWLFRFRDAVAASGIENPTMINLNCFDAGLYTVTDSTPVCYYFQRQTLDHGEVPALQNTYVRNGLVDFLLTRDGPPECDATKYKHIMEGTIDQPEYSHVFYLYQRIGD